MKESSIIYRLFDDEFQRDNYPNTIFDDWLDEGHSDGYSADANVILTAIKVHGEKSDSQLNFMCRRANEWLDNSMVTVYGPILEEVWKNIFDECSGGGGSLESLRGYRNSLRKLLNKPNIRFLMSYKTSEPTIWSLIEETDPALADRLKIEVDQRRLSGTDTALIGLSAIEGLDTITFDTKLSSFEYKGLNIHNCWEEKPHEG